MKKKLFYIIQICIVLFAAGGFYSCNDTVNTETDGKVKGISIIPNPMVIGQPVNLSGPNFKDATAIVFPGGVSVTNFTKMGDFELSAIVPEGAASEGKITVSLPNNSYEIPINVVIVSTGNAVATSKDVSPAGNVRVGPNDELVINGTGLSAIAEVVFPGGLSVTSMNFKKKNDATIALTIPMGGFDNKAVEPLKMVTKSGKVIYTSNKIDWSGEGYIPPELLPFCGRTYKIWGWDEDAAGKEYGNGGYNDHKGPTWWVPGAGQFTSSYHGLGATMKFSLPNKMELHLTNGTVYKGTFTVDMTKNVGTWSKGKLMITGGDEALSIVGGTYGTYNNDKAPVDNPWYNVKLYPKTFEIINLTDKKMTLAFRHPWEDSVCDFYLYSLVESGDDIK